ncbi:Gfo/Idh/MocA family protein [Microvirga sp. TS319]|uniref:Gfo/Idh/MocA family protein n=1 Tax=Microvirga sp. TS319 TaxID=3241165 RepID=UPI00351A33D8
MTIGVGVIGTGVMGGDHALILASSVQGAVPVAISDVDANKAAAVAAAARVERIHADAHSLIGDPMVGAVLIAAPDATHEELVLACLSAGKPVLCEKPLSPTVEGCLRIVDAEIAIGKRLVQVGFMRRFDPGYVTMRSNLKSGRFGAPLLMHCIHRNANAPSWFNSAMLISNSAVHEIDIARWLLDSEFTAATVFRRRPTDPGALMDPQFIVLETRQGTLVDIEVFVNARYGYDVRAELVCENGTLALTPQSLVRIRSSGQEISRFAEDWRAHFSAAYRSQLQAWVDSIRTGVPVGASAWDGYAATATAAACGKALESGQATEVRLQACPDLYVS